MRGTIPRWTQDDRRAIEAKSQKRASLAYSNTVAGCLFPWLWAILALIAGGNLLSGQLPDRSSSISRDAAIATVNVEVEENGKLLSGFRSEDFVIIDEGSPQPTLSFSDNPLDVLFLLDTSSSLRPIARQIAESLTASLQALRPEDRVAIMCFNVRGTLILPLTKERRLVDRAVKTVRARSTAGGTDFYASLADAAKYFFMVHRTEAPEMRLLRSAIILMATDAIGPPSTNEEKLVRQLLEANCTLDTLVLGPDAQQETWVRRPPSFVPQDPVRVGARTGGIATVVTRMKDDLPSIFNKGRIRYAIAYRKPALQLGKPHQINVALSPRIRQLHPTAVVYCRNCDDQG